MLDSEDDYRDDELPDTAPIPAATIRMRVAWHYNVMRIVLLTVGGLLIGLVSGWLWENTGAYFWVTAPYGSALPQRSNDQVAFRQANGAHRPTFVVQSEA